MDQSTEALLREMDVVAEDPFPRVLALFALDREDEHFPAQVVSRGHGAYLLRVAEVMQPGRRLVMVDGAFRFEVEVTECCPDREQCGYRLGCQILGYQVGAVRQEWRMPVNAAAKVKILLAGQSYSGRVRDSSPFGLGVELPVCLEQNTAIVIRTSDGLGYGEVRHCRPLENGAFFAGLYLREYLPHPESTWSRRVRIMKTALHRLRASLRYPLATKI